MLRERPAMESPDTVRMGKRLALGAIAGSRGGPRTYAAELIREFARGPRCFERLEVLSERPRDFLPGSPPAWIGGRRLWMPHPTLRPLAERLGIPRALRDARIDLYHGTKNALPGGLPCPAVVTIHDLAPFREPETFSPLSGFYLRRSIRDACERAERIVAVSRHTAHDLREVLGVHPDRIDVVYNGIAPELLRAASLDEVRELRQRLDLDGPILLCVGTVQPRKHQLEVLEAFLRARHRLPRGTTCLFVGRAGWKTAAFEKAYARAEGLQVRWIRDFPDADLRALYGAASVFLAPSTYEGFGLTVAEAMAQGCPVVALDRSATPEVVGSGGVLLPEPDPDLLAEHMVHLLEDRALAQRLSRWAKDRARGFTWARSAARHRAVYARALAGTATSTEGSVDLATDTPARAERPPAFERLSR